jgi:hypothetical protein
MTMWRFSEYVKNATYIVECNVLLKIIILVISHGIYIFKYILNECDKYYMHTYVVLHL